MRFSRRSINCRSGPRLHNSSVAGPEGHARRASVPGTCLLLSGAEEAMVAAQRVSEGSSGSLTLGFVGSATYDAIPSILRCFHQIAPQVELTLSEMTVHVQLEALAEKRIDLGFLRLPARTEGLVFRTVSREALLIALPSSHSLAQIPVLRLSSLAGDPFILYPDHPRPSWAEFIVGLCPQAGFRPTIAQRTVEIRTTLSLVAAGMGVSLVPACVSNIPLGRRLPPPQRSTCAYPTAGGLSRRGHFPSFAELLEAHAADAPHRSCSQQTANQRTYGSCWR